MRHGTADILYGLFLGAIAIALFAHTFSDIYEFNPLIENVSTVFFPRIILGAIVICASALISQGVRNTDPDDHLPQIDVKRTLLVFAAVAATTAGIWFIGYFYAMPVGVFLTGWALRYPNKWILAATSVSATVIVWVALAHFAAVTFPTEFRLF